jgi:hypothetical protein
MSTEPHAIIRASHACQEPLPDDVYLHASLDGKTLTRLSKIELRPNGRVRIIYTKDTHRHQITVESDEVLILSFQDLTGQNSHAILRQARRAASPFRRFGAPPRATEVEPLATSVLTAMQGANFFG